MADQTSFDLNQAIQAWRDNLANSPAFRRENLNELESHLRDSIATLQTRGLSAEESFLIATRRLGQNQHLESEFTKINRHVIWLERAMWMLIGIQVWPLFDRLTYDIGMNLFALGWKNLYPSPSGAGEAWLVFVSVLIQLSAFIGAVWLAWAVMKRVGRLGHWVAIKLPGRSSFVLWCFIISLAAVLLYFLVQILPMWSFGALLRYRYSPRQVAILVYPSYFIAPLRAIGFVILTLLLARKRFVPQNA